MNWRARRATYGYLGDDARIPIPAGETVQTGTGLGLAAIRVTFHWEGYMLWLDADRFRNDFERQT